MTCAARRFAREAFAQEPINHQLGLDLKLGWYGVRDCAGPPPLLARDPAENFGCDWRVVDMAVDRGVIRLAVFTIGSKDIVLGYTVPMAPRGGASDLCDPRRGSLERLNERLRREGLCEIGETPGLKRSLANGGFVVSGHVDHRHSHVRCFEAVPQLDA